MGLDIGPDSVKTFSDALDTTQTVIWNGPMGVFEFDKFAVGTEVIILDSPVNFLNIDLKICRLSKIENKSDNFHLFDI